MNNLNKSNEKDAVGTLSELQAAEDLSLRMGLDTEARLTVSEMREAC